MLRIAIATLSVILMLFVLAAPQQESLSGSATATAAEGTVSYLAAKLQLTSVWNLQRLRPATAYSLRFSCQSCPSGAGFIPIATVSSDPNGNLAWQGKKQLPAGSYLGSFIATTEGSRSRTNTVTFVVS